MGSFLTDTGVLPPSFSLSWFPYIGFSPAWAPVVCWPKFDWISFGLITLQSGMRWVQFQLCKNGFRLLYFCSLGQGQLHGSAINLSSHTGPHTQASCCHHLEILHLSLNFHFLSKVQWDNGACIQTGKMCGRKVHFSTFMAISWCFEKGVLHFHFQTSFPSYVASLALRRHIWKWDSHQFCFKKTQLQRTWFSKVVFEYNILKKVLL